MNEHPDVKQRILVADDDRHIADLVRMYLAKTGYDVTDRARWPRDAAPAA